MLHALNNMERKACEPSPGSSDSAGSSQYWDADDNDDYDDDSDNDDYDDDSDNDRDSEDIIFSGPEKKKEPQVN